MFVAGPNHALGALVVEQLRTEYAANPLGIDVLRPRLSWTFAAGERGEQQTAYQVIVASDSAPLANNRGDVWDSGKVSSDQNFGIEFAGPELKAGRRYHWKVRVWGRDDQPSAWSAPAWWEMGLLTPAAWKAKWISAPAELSSPLLRKEFSMEKPIARARAYVFGFGWYRLHLNGSEVGARGLAPVNSNYEKGLFYDTYDVTAQIISGRNAVGVWLGGGYDQNYSKYGYRWLGPLAALVQLQIDFSDGTRAMVLSDETWKTSDSPITTNHIYNGETYDARREKTGWDTIGYNDAGWSPATVATITAGPLTARLMPPVQVVASRRPVRIMQPKPGVYVFDFDQNFAGWTRLHVKGDPGGKVILRHAEEINPDGSLDVTTNRAAQATDTYILKGSGEENYEPRFTYHGFRYVELTGFPGSPTLDTVEGRVVHATVDDAGSFTCSDPLINRIHENFRWSILNNLMGIPTDTAARDERTPCQMDSMVVEETAMHNFEVDAYYAKWLHDIAGDAVAAPNWAGDQVVLPWRLYQHYGDRRVLERNFANMKRVTDAFTTQAVGEHPWQDGYGDWCPPGQSGEYTTSFSEGETVNTAVYYHTAEVMAAAAAVLGETGDAARYRRLAGEIRDRFNTKHFDPSTNTYGSGRQVTFVLPLAFGLVPADRHEAVEQVFHQRVIGPDREHLDTGIFGTRYLFDALIDGGFADTAFRVLTQTTAPGYGHQISLDATTTWEQWPFHGGMQSHDHAMFSGPGVTFYTRLAGIRPTAPGYREVLIRPSVPAGLSYVDCSLRTVMGTIVSRWKNAERYEHRLTIPPNTTGTVYIPAPDPGEIREGDMSAKNAPGVRFLRAENGWSVFSIQSGSYIFSAPHSGHF